MANSNEENLRFFIGSEWKDIHHSRIQEWSALGIIAAAHIGLIQILKIIGDIPDTRLLILYLIPFFTLLALLFCLLGIIMVCRHRTLMTIKLNWIYEAEYKLGLIKTKEQPDGIIPEIARMKNHSKWNNLTWPRKFSTSWIMAMIYLVFGILDFITFAYSIAILLMK
jgi:hypothetical protein